MMQADWFGQNGIPTLPPAAAPPTSAPAPASAPAGDWFAQNGVPTVDTATDATPAQKPADRSWLDSVTDYAKEALSGINPVSIIHGIDTAGWHPIDTARALLDSQNAVKAKADEAFKAGDYATGVRHVIDWLIPLLGPRLDQAGDFMQHGEYAKGFGATTDVALQGLAPEALRRLPSVGKIGAPANPVAAEAVRFGEAHAVPLDAATATGSKITRVAQTRVANTIGGARTAELFNAEQADALAGVGNDLAARAHPAGAVTPEQAGQGVSDALASIVGKHHAEANTSYEALRQIEADPVHMKTIEVAPEPDARFASEGAPADALFNGVWRDALKQGYTGTKTDLRAAFQDRVESAKSLKADMTAATDEYGHEALLRSIRELGGLRPWDPDFVQGAPTRKMTGEFDSLRQVLGKRGVFRERGLAVDDMVDQLRQDPRWQPVIGDDRDLMSMLEEVAAGHESNVSGDLEHFLKPTGVQPGTRWWTDEPLSDGSARTVQMPLPVDLRSVKTALAPIYERLTRLYPIAKRQASAGYQAIENIVTGPDHVPLSVADDNLGAIKAIARGADLPGLRSTSQGLAASAVKQLDNAVRLTAASAGPEALKALEAGRAATRSKYAVGSILEQLRDEPVQTFGKLTYANDAGVRLLRKVAKVAPEELPKIGRAFLDDLVRKATADGGFTKAKTVATSWEKLGPQTKALLFKDPGLVQDIDNFFRLAKMTAENPNPSGTAHSLSVFNVTSALAGYPLSKLFYTRWGVRLLTKGLQLPLGDKAARAAYVSELLRAANDATMTPRMPVPAAGTASSKPQR